MSSRRLLLLAAVLGCARAPRPASVLATSAACAPSQPTAGADTIAIVLNEPVEPAHAPLPRNDAEALVFRQFYETLVRVDCDGVVRPGLALAWRDLGPEWTFTLRRNAAFRDGGALDATTLLDAWRAANPATLVSGVRSDGIELTVFLTAPVPVTYFASPALRLVKPASDASWPIGTGGWAPRSGATGPVLYASAGGAGRPVLRFEFRLGADPRDLIDAAAHALVTRDRAALDYAAGLPGWTTVPQGWDRLYLLLSDGVGPRDTAASAAIRESLARDALRGDARPASPELVAWLGRCTAAPDGASAATGPTRRRVVYPRGDPTARALAERLVARAESDLSVLLGTPAVTPGSTVTAAGLAPEALDRAVRERADLALVMPLLHQWAGDCGPLAAVGHGWRLVEPLVETRAHALVRAGAAWIVADRDGILIEPAGRPR